MSKRFKLFIGTPMFGGVCCGAFSNSCIGLQNVMSRVNVEVEYCFLYDDALVTRARNNIVAKFLQSDCTHLLFIDADIEFNPSDVPRLLFMDKDIIGAPYPKKTINWHKAAHAVKTIPNLDPNHIEKFVGEYVFNLKDHQQLNNMNNLHNVNEAGTGFLMIKRSVFETMKASYPQLRYKTDEDVYQYAFFSTLIDSKGSLTGGGSDRYLSEDYAFCTLWSKLGGNILLAPWVALKHIGSYSYTCDFPFIVSACSNQKA